MTIIRKTVAERDGLDFVLSDETVDRYGDVIDAKGWDLKNFRKNPIALFGHSAGFPIGTWSNIRVEGGKLMARLNLAAKGTSQRIDELISLVEQGILRAVSVGFRPLEAEPIDKEKPFGGQRYTKQELLETSLVSVPANPAALAVAKSLNLSPETMSLAFGEQAETRRRDLSATGEQADSSLSDVVRSRVDRPSNRKDPKMKTLSQRIEDAQNDLTDKKDKLAELTAADDLDNDAIEALNVEIEALERSVENLKASEAKIGTNARSADPAAPAVVRRPLGFPQTEVKASDLIVRAAVCHLLAGISKTPVEKVLEDRYPGHEATAAVTKTAIAVATTTTSGWASQLVETAMAEFLALLPANSIYPALRSMGVGLTFGANSGAIKIPFSSTTAALAGGFVLEGDPIPVGRLTLDSVTLTPHKFGIIVPMTKEVMRYTNPALEAIVRSELLARTAIKLDSLLLDNTAGSATRPAGLLYNVSAAGTAYGGGDFQAFLEDMKTLLSPFDTANAGRSLALIMNPAQARNVRMMAGPNSAGFGWANQFLADFRVIVSTSATAGTVIAIDTADFVTGTGDSPQFEASEQATIHMEDTPTALSAVASPNTVAAPIRSMFQTNSVALRMLMDVTWAMRRSGMVQWISGVTW
jgi:HK97 family phage major capsid protein/HK97 family phage prohead protease